MSELTATYVSCLEYSLDIRVMLPIFDAEITGLIRAC